MKPVVPIGIESVKGFPSERKVMWGPLKMMCRPHECKCHEYYLQGRVRSFKGRIFSRYVCHHCGDWFNYWD